MVFERIMLIDIYDTLKTIETNENMVTSILINRATNHKTKTIPRFDTLASLKAYITTNYPYRRLNNPELECFTCNENLITLLNFSIRHNEDVIFVNNLRSELQSTKDSFLNKTSIDALTALFNKYNEMKNLYLKYQCVETPSYFTNTYYDKLIVNYYQATRRPDFPGYMQVDCN